MASIVETISGDRALQLGNEEFVRKMAIGNNWNKLRLGMRVLVNGTGDIVTPRLQMGVCSGDTDTFASTNCTGYAGATLRGRNSGNMTYSAGVYTYGQAAAVPFALSVKKLVNTVTESNFVGTSDGFLPSATLGNAALCFVDIVRASSSSYTVSWARCSTSAMASLVTDFYTLLRTGEDENLSTTFSSTYTVANTIPISVTGLPAVMDTLSIYWNKSTPTVEISDISVIRFY